MPELPSGKVTFLFTDVEGSTKLWEQDPETMGRALAQHDALLRAAIESHHGHVFKTIGDAFCAAFASAREAVQGAVEAQQVLQREVPHLRVRMALHTGEAELRDGDYFGPGLSRVDRLLSSGHGGQVLLSRATAELVGPVLPVGVAYSTEGKTLFVRTQGAVILCSVDQRREVAVFKAARRPSSVAVAPDGRTVATGEGVGDYAIRLWRGATFAETDTR